MLATPTYDGKVECEYTHSLVQSIMLCAQHEINLYPVWWPHEALVQHARNMLLMLALEARVDDIVFVDADQTWEASEMLSLLTHKVDCVGAAVRLKCEEERYNVRAIRPPYQSEHHHGLLIVDSVGTGFLRLSNSAMGSVWELSKPYTKNGQDARMAFDVCVVAGHLVGEDVTMCEKLKEWGIDVHIDPAINPGHIGHKKYTGNFANYLARLMQQEHCNGTHRQKPPVPVRQRQEV